MNKSTLTNIQVGAFVLASIALVAIGLLWIAGSAVFGEKQQSYRVVMTNSGGLQPGDRVRVAGVSVGRIQHIDLRIGDAFPVTLHIGIKATVSIGIDSTARVGP